MFEIILKIKAFEKEDAIKLANFLSDDVVNKLFEQKLKTPGIEASISLKETIPYNEFTHRSNDNKERICNLSDEFMGDEFRLQESKLKDSDQIKEMQEILKLIVDTRPRNIREDGMWDADILAAETLANPGKTCSEILDIIESKILKEAIKGEEK